MGSSKNFFIFLTITTSSAWSITNISAVCDEHWWKQASIHHLDNSIRQWKVETATNTICDENGNSPFHLAVMFSPYKEVIHYLLDLGFSVEQENQLGQNALELALMNENPEILQELQTPSQAHDQEYLGSKLYLGAGISSNLLSQMNQFGNNKDTTCYPNDNCFITSYPNNLWFHNINKDPSLSLEFFIGTKFFTEELRVEVAFALDRNNLDQGVDQYRRADTTHLDYYQSQAIISSNTESQIDNMTTNTLSLNLYYDFEDLFSERVTPNVGFGLGVTHINIGS